MIIFDDLNLSDVGERTSSTGSYEDAVFIVDEFNVSAESMITQIVTRLEATSPSRIFRPGHDVHYIRNGLKVKNGDERLCEWRCGESMAACALLQLRALQAVRY